MSGVIDVDGSSTVYPISAAMAEEFMNENPGVNITVAFSGTGGGFQKVAAGEIDISNASRLIKEEERAQAEQSGNELIELKVAMDGISIVVNPRNDFVDYLTVEELRKIWTDPNVKTWKDVRPEWPDEAIKLYGPGTDSGTFDYFNEAVAKDAHRSDYQASEDDNVLVTGVSGDKYALGYFGFAYYVENKDKLKAVPIDNGDGPVEPTDETINQGTYRPLSRPIFIYVNKERYETRPELKAFVNFYLENTNEISPSVGYIALPEDVLAEQIAKLDM